MMPSLRKKVAGFIRQLSNNPTESVINEKNDSSGSGSGCFIQRYLSGRDVKHAEPLILHGRNPHELPPRQLGSFTCGPHTVFAALTGPDGGLTTVNRRQRHLSTSDPDVDYIDIADQQGEHERYAVKFGESAFSRGWFATRPPPPRPIDNTVMHIRAAGSVFSVGTRSVHTSVSDLQTFVDEDGSLERARQKNTSLDFELIGNYDSLEREADENRNTNCLSYDSGTSEFLSESGGRFPRGIDVGILTYDCGGDRRREKNVNDFSRSKEAIDTDTLEVNGNREPSFPDVFSDSDAQDSAIEEDMVIPPPAEYATNNLPASPCFTPIRKSKSAPPPLSCRGDNSEVCQRRLESSRSAGSEPLREEVAGVTNWFRPHARAYGAATTLYEQNPMTKENAGNPIADCFGIVARYDSAILALADGVNWGEKACVAARSAIHGCIEYLNKAVFGSLPTVMNSTEVFVALLRSFHAAHSLILQEHGMLTTLTVAVILPLAKSERFLVCVCNVGDSLAYVYSKKHGVREITKGSHDIHCMRDMRDALGALGPVDGQNPELNNLTCSMTEVDQGDIVFLTSDGISDNFDPVVGKFAVMPPLGEEDGPPLIPSSHCLPTVQAYQRHELSLLRMDDLLKHGVSGEGPPCSDARTLCELLLDFATRLTAAKRRILEDSDLYCTQDPVTGKMTELSRGEQRSRRKKACEKLSMMPGKLDHATVVAFKVEQYQDSDGIPETAL